MKNVKVLLLAVVFLLACSLCVSAEHMPSGGKGNRLTGHQGNHHFDRDDMRGDRDSFHRRQLRYFDYPLYYGLPYDYSTNEYDAYPGILTLADIIRMTRLGFADTRIIEVIRGTGSAFDLTPEDEGYLRAQGVSPVAIDCMDSTAPGR